MLKLGDKLVPLKNKTDSIIIKLNDLNIKLFYDNSKNVLEEMNNLEKEKEKLLISIERRKKLLSNEGYLAKAPQNIVQDEKNSLQKEEERMSTILIKNILAKSKIIWYYLIDLLIIPITSFLKSYKYILNQ